MATRRTMKLWLTRNFNKSIVFLQHENNKGQYIMSKDSLDSVGKGEKLTSATFSLSDDTTIKHAAKVLRRIIEDYTDQA